jgi:hypothetical protein
MKTSDVTFVRTSSHAATSRPRLRKPSGDQKGQAVHLSFEFGFQSEPVINADITAYWSFQYPMAGTENAGVFLTHVYRWRRNIRRDTRASF